MNPEQLISKMKVKAEAVQAVVGETTSLENTFNYAIEMTQQQGGRNLAAAGFTPEQEDMLDALCRDAGLILLKPPLRDHGDAIHTAVTPVSWGLADTGTLVLPSADEDVRLATMLADTHVACLWASQIRPDMEGIQTELDQILKTEPTTYVTFITGPSRTADIERVLAIGVHGPQELHILIRKDR
jgi:L-lactate dehydrogenase complex protein LldG